MKCRGRIARYGTVDFLHQLLPNRWYNIGGGVLDVDRWDGGYIRNFALLPFWVTPCELYRANWEIRHGSLFTAATAPTGRITLVALYSAWAAGMEDI